MDEPTTPLPHPTGNEPSASPPVVLDYLTPEGQTIDLKRIMAAAIAVRWCMILQVLMWFLVVACIAVGTAAGYMDAMYFLGIVILMILCLSIASAVCLARLCTFLIGRRHAVAFGLISLMPGIGLLMLFAAERRARWFLRNQGVRLGLFGEERPRF